MNDTYIPLIGLPAELSDQAAINLIDMLYELAAALENRYAAELERYYNESDQQQLDLWQADLDNDDYHSDDDYHDDPPF